ncbi:hypothetical protein Agub_g14381, partial [Astrephomene gubernaculifera]
YQQLMTVTGAAQHVMKFDHCHKPAKSIRMPDATSKACIGTAWVLNGHSEALAFYHVSSTSLYELRYELRQLSLRCLNLGQAIRVVYVDNAAQTHRIWCKLLLTDLPSGEVMVKQDTFHLKRRFTEALPKAHPYYSTFNAALSQVLLPIYEPDRERLHGIDAQLLRRKARKFIPPGSGGLVLRRVGELMARYKALKGGEEFITAAVEKVWRDQQALVADGLDMISDPFSIDKMYYVDPKTGLFRSIRTTSQVENLNRRFNSLLQGSVLPGLADALIMDFVGRNNVDQASRAGESLGLPLAMYDLHLVSRINACVPPGAVKPFEKWAALQDRVSASAVEDFGFKWQERQIREALLEVAAAEAAGASVQVVVDEEDDIELDGPPLVPEVGGTGEEWDAFWTTCGAEPVVAGGDGEVGAGTAARDPISSWASPPQQMYGPLGSATLMQQPDSRLNLREQHAWGQEDVALDVGVSGFASPFSSPSRPSSPQQQHLGGRQAFSS